MIGLKFRKNWSSFWPLPRYLSRLSLESFETGQTESLIRNEYKWISKILTLLEWYMSNIQQFDEKRIWSLYRRFQVWGRWFTIKLHISTKRHNAQHKFPCNSRELRKNIGFYEIWWNLCILISPDFGWVFRLPSQAGGTHDVDRTLAMSGLLSDEATRGHFMRIRKFYPSELELDLKQPGFVSNVDHNPMRSMRWYFAVVTCYNDWRIGGWWSLQSANVEACVGGLCWWPSMMSWSLTFFDLPWDVVSALLRGLEEEYEPLLFPIWSKFCARSFHFSLFHPVDLGHV